MGFTGVNIFAKLGGGWHSIREKLRGDKYDILEFYGTEFWLPTWQLSKSEKRPFVVAHSNGLELLAFEQALDHNHHSSSLRSRFHSWCFRQTHARFLRIAISRADAFVALCEQDRQLVLSLGLTYPERATVVEPGIDDEYLSVPFSPNREERVAFNGTLIPRKGIDKLLKVMTKLLMQNPNLSFDVYGTWWSFDKIIDLFPSELHPRVVVYSNLSNEEMAKSLSRAKVFFFPSQYEGFGLALAEAMACGCAAVTTPTGFGADLCNGKEALICDFNDVDEMEQSVLKLLRDNNLRQSIASNGWKRVKALTWEASIKKLETTYIDWIKNHRSVITKSRNENNVNQDGSRLACID